MIQRFATTLREQSTVLKQFVLRKIRAFLSMLGLRRGVRGRSETRDAHGGGGVQMEMEWNGSDMAQVANQDCSLKAFCTKCCLSNDATQARLFCSHFLSLGVAPICKRLIYCRRDATLDFIFRP
jgi:hypothetical protein